MKPLHGKGGHPQESNLDGVTSAGTCGERFSEGEGCTPLPPTDMGG